MKFIYGLRRINNLSTMEKVALIVTTGVVFRLLLLPLIDVDANIGIGDDGYYLALAEAIRGGHYSLDGVPNFERPPGYPFFLAVALTQGAAMMLQSAASIAVALVVMFTLRTVWPALLIAACPFLIGYDFKFYSETLFISLLVAALMVLFERGPRRAAIGGVILGLAILTRETLLLLPVLLVVVSFGLKRQKDMLIAAVAAYLVVLPWATRNAFIPGGSFALSQSHPGFNLWIGTWERNGDWMRDGVKIIENYPSYAFRTPEEKNQLSAALPSWNDRPFRQAAIDRIISEPVEVAGTWMIRYPQMWIGTRTEQWYLRIEGPSWVAFKSIMLLLNALVLVLGLWGAWVALRLRTSFSLLVVPVAYHALIYIPFHNVEDRYTLPAIPFLLILGFYGIITSRDGVMKSVKSTP